MKPPPMLRGLLVLGVVAGGLGPVHSEDPATGIHPAASGAEVLEWNHLFTASVMRDSVAPGHVSRRAAILSLAAYDAYRGEASLPDSCPEHPQRESSGTGADEPERELAALAALHHGSLVLFPSHSPAMTEWWQRARDARIARGLDQARAASCEARGKAWAYAYLKGRADDGATSQITDLPSAEPGHWRRTPPRYRPPELPHWGHLRPFCLERADQFRPPPPPALDSDEYREALEEVRTMGGQDPEASARSSDDTESGRFWACFSYTPTPAGHWNTLLNTLLRERNADFPEALDAYRLLNVALADAFIACWDAKYHYRFWRPEDAIRAAGDEDWTPLLESPPHPEYVSGHSAAAGAGAEILRRLFGDRIGPVDLTSASLPGAVRSFESILECRDEMGRSRVYGGIHFSFSNREGKRLGEQVAGETWQRLAPPTSGERPSGD